MVLYIYIYIYIYIYTTCYNTQNLYTLPTQGAAQRMVFIFLYSINPTVQLMATQYAFCETGNLFLNVA